MSAFSLKDRFLAALSEDCPTQDVTAALMGNVHRVSAHIVSRETGVFSGREWVRTIAETFSEQLDCECFLQEGDSFAKGTILLALNGPSDLVVRVERVLLNILQHVCGIATITQAYVNALEDGTISVLDTRKTLPLWRDLEKKAVLAGGGKNHRHSLSDMILIKENHLTAFFATQTTQDLAEQFRLSKLENPALPIEIEVETLDQCRDLPFEHVDYILMDNFTVDELKQGVQIVRDRGFLSEIEVSGNVSLKTISQYRGLPVDRISVGRLTHSVKAIDLSLLIED